MRIDELINESMDRVYPYVIINQQPNVKYYRITAPNNHYIICALRFIPYKNKIVSDLAFWNEESKSFTATNSFNAGETLSLLNTITNIATKELPNFDVCYFTAKFSESAGADEYEKKTHLYSRIAERVARKNNVALRMFPYTDGTIMVVSKFQITKELLLDFINAFR